ncbi:anti-sigma B factor antagonist [Kitasatospora sp. SolWspMP-SS2h]|uniref:STAS domain-containing protein n=1 Tax=Kitasatospora sp. SolWspMP-SS2h TaxID=1305729 RepID=UPI000DB9B54E|nr:STAS domain-containing protein [Kitasatospora sp. SolWspMP-SS2h]RAJ29828.1 anti-sigma B factor antagonist [Kitasatospora sp. SolWspMP-SS2h]
MTISARYTPAAWDTLDITVLDAHGPVRAVRVGGELDLHSAWRLTPVLAALLSPRPAALVLDLAPLDFCDSMGLHEFIKARHHAKGVPLILAALPRHLRRLMEISGLERLFTITASLTEALAQPTG